MQKQKSSPLYIRVEGIYCPHCIDTITLALQSLDGVESVAIRQNVACVTGETLPEKDKIIDVIRKAGYETNAQSISFDRRKVAKPIRWYEVLLIAAGLLLAAFAINRLFGYNIFNAIPAVDSGVSYGMLFVTGLLTSIHCISMCGAISLYVSAEKNAVRSLRRPLLYNAGRVLSYTLIGGVVGLAGSVFSVSAKLRGAIILAAAVFMLGMALSMLGVFQLRLPRFFSVRPNRAKAGAFAVGLLNGLMPCGPLQAMQLYALSTGSFFSGAFSMLLFALGTVPLMLLSGAAVNLSRGKAKRVIGKVACVLILLLSLSMLNRGLLGLGVDASKLFSASYNGYTPSVVTQEVQTVQLELDYDSFGDVVVQVGIPVELHLHADAQKLTGCNNEVVCDAFGFDVPLQPGDNRITFTPTETGDYTYTCWMNMIRNHIRVIDDINYFKGGD